MKSDKDLLSACVSHLRSGKVKEEIIPMLQKKGYGREEIEIALEESDQIIIEGIDLAPQRERTGGNYLTKVLFLLAFLVFLILVFFDQMTVGIIILFLMYIVLRSTGLLTKKKFRDNRFDKNRW